MSADPPTPIKVGDIIALSLIIPNVDGSTDADIPTDPKSGKSFDELNVVIQCDNSKKNPEKIISKHSPGTDPIDLKSSRIQILSGKNNHLKNGDAVQYDLNYLLKYVGDNKFSTNCDKKDELYLVHVDGEYFSIDTSSNYNRISNVHKVMFLTKKNFKKESGIESLKILHDNSVENNSKSRGTNITKSSILIYENWDSSTQWIFSKPPSGAHVPKNVGSASTPGRWPRLDNANSQKYGNENAPGGVVDSEFGNVKGFKSTEKYYNTSIKIPATKVSYNNFILYGDTVLLKYQVQKGSIKLDDKFISKQDYTSFEEDASNKKQNVYIGTTKKMDDLISKSDKSSDHASYFKILLPTSTYIATQSQIIPLSKECKKSNQSALLDYSNGLHLCVGPLGGNHFVWTNCVDDKTDNVDPTWVGCQLDKIGKCGTPNENTCGGNLSFTRIGCDTKTKTFTCEAIDLETNKPTGIICSDKDLPQDGKCKTHYECTATNTWSCYVQPKDDPQNPDDKTPTQKKEKFIEWVFYIFIGLVGLSLGVYILYNIIGNAKKGDIPTLLPSSLPSSTTSGSNITSS